MTELSVDVQTLVSHAQERYEDAYVCDGVRRFIAYVGAVPDVAFGWLPWSTDWKDDWGKARDSRADEATKLRDVLADTSGALYQVAADYTDADITSAMELDISVADLAAFVPDPTQPGVTYHPGAGPGYYSPPAAPVDGTYAPMAPREDSLLYWVSLTNLIGTQQIIDKDYVSDVSRVEDHYADWVGRNELIRFLAEHGQDLRDVEATVQALDPTMAKPMAGQIDVAAAALPKILYERGDLFHSLARSYKEMRDEYAGEALHLQSYWYSPGAATAYFNHVNVVNKYVDALVYEANWLAGEGKKCATLIDDLQGKYAQIGYDRVGLILDRYQAYLDTMKGLTKPTEPWQTLSTAWHAFATEIINTEQTSLDLSKQMLTLSQTVIDKRPELASPAHDPAIFPTIEGSDVWKDGDTWQPQNKPTPAPIA